MPVDAERGNSNLDLNTDQKQAWQKYILTIFLS
jgi:hypothetical protein